MRSEACRTAQILSKKVWHCRFQPNANQTINADLADASGAAINNGHHNTATNTNITIHIHFPPDVFPAGGDDESMRMSEVLAQDDVLDMVTYSDKLSDVLGKCFHYTRGEAGPAELQNVRFDGEHVYELREQEKGKQTVVLEVKYTPRKYVVVSAVPRLMVILKEACDYAIHTSTMHADLARRIKRKFFESTVRGAKNRRYTYAEAVNLAATNNADFHKHVPGEMKQEILDTVQHLVHTILPDLKRAQKQQKAKQGATTQG